MLAAALAAAAVTAAVGAAAQPAGGWSTYHDPKAGFSIQTPIDAKIYHLPLPTKMGWAPSVIGSVKLENKAGLLFSASDYSGLKVSSDPNVVLENGVKDAVAQSHAALDSEQSISVGGAPGRDIVVHSQKGGARARLVYRDRQMYLLVGVGPLGDGPPREYERFAGSLAFDH